MWETYTDADIGRFYYYNSDTGVIIWESFFEVVEGVVSSVIFSVSVGSGESVEIEWG